MINAGGRLVQKTAALRSTCVIDEHADAGVIAQTCFDGGHVIVAGQVSLQHIDGDAVLFTQTGRENVHARLVTGDQHQIVTAACETIGVHSADAGGCASDENRRKCCHGSALLQKESLRCPSDGRLDLPQ